VGAHRKLRQPTLVRRFEETWDEVIAALESGADLVEVR
jgi:hypothetical protein